MGVRAEKIKAPNLAVGRVFPRETDYEQELARYCIGTHWSSADEQTWTKASYDYNLSYFKEVADAVAIDVSAPSPNIRGCTSPERLKAYLDRIGAAMFGTGVQPSGGQQLSVPRVRQTRTHDVTLVPAEAVEQCQSKRRLRADSRGRKGTVSNHTLTVPVLQQMLKGILQKQLAGQRADSCNVSRQILTYVPLYLFLAIVWYSCIDR